MEQINLVTIGPSTRLARRFTHEVDEPYRVIKHIDINQDEETLSREIQSVKWDYAVLLYWKTESQYLKDLLRIVPRNRILDYSDYINGFDKWDPTSPKRMSGYDGYYFGMSHSQLAFLPWLMDISFINCSRGSTDLFFYYQMLKHYLQSDRAHFTSAKYFVFEMPYYFFNWDLSKAKKH